MALNVIPDTLGSEQIQLAHMKTLKDYQASRENLWPSLGSLEWYVRRNYQRLVERGALVKLNGRKLVVAPLFDATACEMSREAIQNERRRPTSLPDAKPGSAEPGTDSSPAKTQGSPRVRRTLPPWFTD